MKDLQAYQIYTKCLTRDISLSTWKRHKSLMRSVGSTLTKTNLEMFASVIKLSTKYPVSQSKTVRWFYSLSDIKVSRGIDLYFHTIKVISPYQAHRTTISRWFPDGYQPERIYQSSEVAQILLSSFIYKLRKSNGTNKSGNRKNQISLEQIRA